MSDQRQLDIDACVRVIGERAPGFAPRFGMVLGSGLGPLAEAVEAPVIVDYADLPGFPKPGVQGHAGRLVLGTLAGVPVAVMQGRAHYYERGDAAEMAVPVRTLAAIGCDTLILTNAAGSLDRDLGPGTAMLIADHINLTGATPLFGEEGNSRFIAMAGAYDPEIRAGLKDAAAREGIDLTEGVYCWFAGPQFETPAEIRMAKLIGGTAVGMSTVPEVILARHAGLRVAAISNITNLGAGMSDEQLSHEHTQQQAVAGAAKIRRILETYLATL